jgi:hypothetical protein
MTTICRIFYKKSTRTALFWFPEQLCQAHSISLLHRELHTQKFLIPLRRTIKHFIRPVETTFNGKARFRCGTTPRPVLGRALYPRDLIKVMFKLPHNRHISTNSLIKKKLNFPTAYRNYSRVHKLK